MTFLKNLTDNPEEYALPEDQQKSALQSFPDNLGVTD